MEQRSQRKFISQESKESLSEQLGSNNLKESFSHAIEGIIIAIFQEKNLRIHFFIGFSVLLVSIFIPIDKNEYIWLFFAVFFVILAELINTLIENILDLFIPDFHPVVKVIKDISSGIVLWSSMFSVIVGIVVFGSYFFAWNFLVVKILGFIFLSIFPFIAVFYGYKKLKDIFETKRTKDNNE